MAVLKVCPFSLFLFTTIAISFTQRLKRNQQKNLVKQSNDTSKKEDKSSSSSNVCSSFSNQSMVDASSQCIITNDQNVQLGNQLIENSALFADEFASSIPFLNTSQLTRNKQHRVLFILGGPGAGKGTQCAKIVDSYKCVHLSVGELLRQERLKGGNSPHAQLIEECLISGQIVPVEISLSLVRQAMDNEITDHSSNTEKKYGQCIFLIDGFPRNYDNLKGWIDQMLQYAIVLGVLVYDCPMNVLEQRILNRGETSGRSDDNIASVRKRFDTFQEQTMPIVNALERVQQPSTSHESCRGMSLLTVQHIAGDSSIDQVWVQTQKIMNTYVQNDVLTANILLLSAIELQDIEVSNCSSDQEFLSLGDTSIAPPVAETGSWKFTTYPRKDDKKQYDFPRQHTVSNATITMQSGTKAVVAYDRYIYGPNDRKIDSFREIRVWSHESKGWVCTQLSRNSL